MSKKQLTQEEFKRLIESNDFYDVTVWAKPYGTELRGRFKLNNLLAETMLDNQNKKSYKITIKKCEVNND